MRIPHSLLALLALPVTLSAQSAFFGRNSQSDADATLAAANPEVRRAQPVSRATAVAPAATTVTTAGSNLGATFRVGDTFELRMTGMPAEDAIPYATAFTISGDGMVNIPLGGQVRAAGLTQSQLEKAIERRLIDEKIFTNPTANVSLPNNQGTRYVTVGGQVRSPNRQPWTPDLTLLTAVEAAGGPGDFSGKKIDLIRNGEKTTYDIRKLREKPADDPILRPGDRLDMR